MAHEPLYKVSFCTERDAISRPSNHGIHTPTPCAMASYMEEKMRDGMHGRVVVLGMQITDT